MVFQDPRSSLNPRWRVARAILRPLRIQGLGSWPDEKTALARVLADVELDAGVAESYPYALSGGEAQRVCIARALVLRPRLVIADEALSGLDVTTQASVLALMMRLRREHDTAFLFISHDLRTVRSISDRVAVMSEGRIVEFRRTAELFDDPHDEYTRRLLTDVIHTHTDTPQTSA
jgi:ABC-type dipeptide/oligopeptide/nickel transport system ATPase subunit